MLTKLPKHTYLILLTLLANLCYAINVVTNKESYNLLGNDITSVNAYMGIRTIIIGIVMWIIYSKINNERTKSQSFNVFDILIFVVVNTVLKRIFLNVGQIGLDNFTF